MEFCKSVKAIENATISKMFSLVVKIATTEMVSVIPIPACGSIPTSKVLRIEAMDARKLRIKKTFNRFL